jgi:hypothetical protein
MDPDHTGEYKRPDQRMEKARTSIAELLTTLDGLQERLDINADRSFLIVSQGNRYQWEGRVK